MHFRCLTCPSCSPVESPYLLRRVAIPVRFYNYFIRRVGMSTTAVIVTICCYITNTIFILRLWIFSRLSVKFCFQGKHDVIETTDKRLANTDPRSPTDGNGASWDRWTSREATVVFSTVRAPNWKFFKVDRELFAPTGQQQNETSVGYSRTPTSWRQVREICRCCHCQPAFVSIKTLCTCAHRPMVETLSRF